jgi:AcrR family transcriptional regulator
MQRGRPREFDRDKGLQDAMLVFWHKGYNATSIPDLCHAIGISAPSLYAAFGSKEKLFVEAVRLYVKTSYCLLWNHLTNDGSAYESMGNLLLASAKLLSDFGAHPVGCLVMLTTIDEDMPVAVAREIKKSRLENLNCLNDRLNTAIKAGELPPSTDANALARFYLAMIQGMANQAHDGATLEQLKGMASFAMAAWPGKLTRAKAAANKSRIGSDEPQNSKSSVI